MNNAKYCSLYVDVFGKYKVSIRAFIDDKLKTIKSVPHLTQHKAKSLLEANGVNPQELEMTFLHMEEAGQNHADFSANGKLIFCDFTGINQ